MKKLVATLFLSLSLVAPALAQTQPAFYSFGVYGPINTPGVMPAATPVPTVAPTALPTVTPSGTPPPVRAPFLLPVVMQATNAILNVPTNEVSSSVVPPMNSPLATSVSLSCNSINANTVIVTVSDLTAGTTLATISAVNAVGNTGPSQPGNSYIQAMANVPLVSGHIIQAASNDSGGSIGGCSVLLSGTSAL